MKKLLIATALLATTTLANASDMARPVMPPVLATWSWTGFYVGAMAGGGWDSASNTLAGYGQSLDLPTKGNGVLAGGFAGYNYAWGPVVLGLETDIAWTNIRGSTSAGGHVATITGSMPWALEGSNHIE